MGLDVVELIMDIEDEFNIEISDEEAWQAITVEKMYQCILTKVQVSNSSLCSSQKAFYLLRKALIENFNIERKTITPKTKTDLLFPKIQRGELWEKVSVNVPYKFPELTYPTNAIILILSISLMGGGLCSYTLAICLKSTFISFIAALTWIVFAVVFSIILLKNLKALKLEFPHACHTIGQMAKNVLYHNSDYFGLLNEKEIWDKLTFIISEQLGIDQKDIKPESNFVKDFNI